MNRKKEKLGMNPSTARARLMKDLLFKFVVRAGHKCYRCGRELTKETFSLDHKNDWLDAENSSELFFDVENVAFSHVICNTLAAADKNRKYHNEEDRRRAKTESKNRWYRRLDKGERSTRRRDQYVRHGH